MTDASQFISQAGISLTKARSKHAKGAVVDLLRFYRDQIDGEEDKIVARIAEARQEEENRRIRRLVVPVQAEIDRPIVAAQRAAKERAENERDRRTKRLGSLHNAIDMTKSPAEIERDGRLFDQRSMRRRASEGR